MTDSIEKIEMFSKKLDLLIADVERMSGLNRFYLNQFIQLFHSITAHRGGDFDNPLCDEYCYCREVTDLAWEVKAHLEKVNAER